MNCPLLTAASIMANELEPRDCQQEECQAWCPNADMAEGGECGITAVVSGLKKLYDKLDGIQESIETGK